MITKEEIGKRIRELRKEKGISQKQLGVILNRSHAAVSDIERGKTDLTVNDLLIISDYLKTSVTYILNIQISHPNFVVQINHKNNEIVNSDKDDLNITQNPQNKLIQPVI